MSKPILAALGAFTGSSVAVLAVRYLKNEELAYGSALSLGLGMAIGMYAVAQWKQRKEKESSSKLNDPSADKGHFVEKSQPEDND